MSDDNDGQLALKKLLDQDTIAAALYRCATDYPHVGGNGPFNKHWEMTLAAAVIKALERRALLHLLDLPIQGSRDANHRDKRLRLEGRQEQHQQDCRWALISPGVCPTCNELAKLREALERRR